MSADPHVERCDAAMKSINDNVGHKAFCGPKCEEMRTEIVAIAKHLAAYVKQRGGERLAGIERMLEGDAP